jgi:hypothetical protein
MPNKKRTALKGLTVSSYEARIRGKDYMPAFSIEKAGAIENEDSQNGYNPQPIEIIASFFRRLFLPMRLIALSSESLSIQRGQSSWPAYNAWGS